MDGTTKDSIAGCRLFREASLEQVLLEYPPIVLSILKGSTRISREVGPEGIEYFVLSEPNKVEAQYKLRKVDFQRLVSVAKKLGTVPLFRSEPRSDTFDKIRAYLKVEFADRKEP